MGSEKYSEGFKGSIITKVLNRGNQTIGEVCLQENISRSAVYSWLQRYDRGSGMKKRRSSELWSAEVKLEAILQKKNLSEEEYGVFLRKEGLHSHQIDEWKADILKVLDSKVGKFRGVKDGSSQRIRELKRDLHRKDKALAEASALLILQKKVNLIWGKESEDEK